MAFELLKTDYVDAVFEGLRRYLVSENGDGSVSFHDVTNYTVKDGAFFGAKDANTINTAVNAILSALNNGTKLYEVFTQFFETQKELFKNESNAKQDDFSVYIDELQSYMSAKWDELKEKYTGDIQYFKDVQENAFNVWFQMVRDQLTNDVAGNLQTQIGNLTELETEEIGSLTGAINEVHSDIEAARTEITADVDEVNEKIDGIRVLYAEAEKATVAAEQLGERWFAVYTIWIRSVNSDDSYNYYENKKSGDILIVRIKANTFDTKEIGVCRFKLFDGDYISSDDYFIKNIASSENTVEYAYMSMWKKKTLILKVEEFAGKLYLTPINSRFYESSSDYKTDNSEFRTLNMLGANNMYNDLKNDIATRLKVVESGIFTNGAVYISGLWNKKQYLLVTGEYVASTGKYYGANIKLITVPASDTTVAATIGNVYSTTNSGVTISGITPTVLGSRQIKLEAKSTYEVRYSLLYLGE